MPKLKPSEAEIAQRVTLGIIKGRLTEEDIDRHEMAASLFVSLPTWHSRLNDTGEIKLRDLRKIAKKLHFTDEEILRAVKGGANWKFTRTTD